VVVELQGLVEVLVVVELVELGTCGLHAVDVTCKCLVGVLDDLVKKLAFLCNFRARLTTPTC
jgi:hypothetical protein